MKQISYIVLCTFLLFFLSCKKQMVTMNVPWYISLSDSTESNYNIADTLIKYSKVDSDNVINRAQFLSFMANLNAMVKDSISAKKQLREAFKIDSAGICKNLFTPIHNYLVKDRPSRETTIPPILDYDLDYIIELFGQCNIKIPERKGVVENHAKLFYWWCYIRIRDQWYRVPQRNENWEIQTAMDIENQKLFDKIFMENSYPREDYFKYALQLLLLHSDNADWTLKWLNEYLRTFGSDSQTPQFIEHFLWRSYVADEPKIQELIKSYENSK